GPVRRRYMDVPLANHCGRTRILSTRMCSGRVRGVSANLHVTHGVTTRRCSVAATKSTPLRRAVLHLLRAGVGELLLAGVVAHHLLLAIAAVGHDRLFALQQRDVRTQLLAKFGAVGR